MPIQWDKLSGKTSIFTILDSLSVGTAPPSQLHPDHILSEFTSKRFTLAMTIWSQNLQNKLANLLIMIISHFYTQSLQVLEALIASLRLHSFLLNRQGIPERMLGQCCQRVQKNTQCDIASSFWLVGLNRNGRWLDDTYIRDLANIERIRILARW